MTPKQMLKTPVEKRRGAVTQETGSWAYLLIQQEPDRVLDGLLKDKVIGAARRDCLDELRRAKVPRPVGPWGVLIRLRGQPWTYVIADGPRLEWPKEWAARHNWRVALFSLEGTLNTKVARLFDGNREIFNFAFGLIKGPEEGFAFRKGIGDDDTDAAMIRGEAEECSEAWLKKIKSGGDAMDRLARLADAYLPVSLYKNDEEGMAKIGGWDGDPYPDDDDEAEDLPDSAFERVDIFTFGGPETLEPSPAATALGKAVRAGDAKAAQKAIDAGADPNVMYDDERPPLEVALGLGSRFLKGGRFATVSLEKQLALMSVLLKAGAKPDVPDREPAIHTALHWADEGDEKDIVAQLRLLLDFKADPNALGQDLRSAGQRPLHVVARYNPWLAVAKLLAQHGADLTLRNRADQTPLQAARKLAEELKASVAKHAPEANANPGTLADSAKLFTKGIMS